MGQKMYKVEEVALKLGCSVFTINTWYRWRKTHDEHPIVELLPLPKQETSRSTRYWTEQDIKKLKEFKATIPHGRHGLLGDTTQQYKRRKKND